ncbi:hypothetical protein NE237_026244 [Protea cynaroides]|uniref:Uncharacterized protein n=1 Tax=Protea cynaroides TaxID=273540 RepID=A0A9Q0K2J6_9MAGN|nr:hypothetical protein NE237_026244 [Protea cynaroides]
MDFAAVISSIVARGLQKDCDLLETDPVVQWDVSPSLAQVRPEVVSGVHSLALDASLNSFLVLGCCADVFGHSDGAGGNRRRVHASVTTAVAVIVGLPTGQVLLFTVGLPKDARHLMLSCLTADGSFVVGGGVNNGSLRSVQCFSVTEGSDLLSHVAKEETYGVVVGIGSQGRNLIGGGLVQVTVTSKRSVGQLARCDKLYAIIACTRSSLRE